ncbi:putative poly(beta-D-mannuronate) O-acetylase [Candidatus Rhodobacter oscarellae]|uniref:Putative poly(Beta-D-mannuronate) O-acetylase n=1 Tax=Candidatus Rhodobacter oscarellae TaxID=1675527 RepID=A0A0J9E1J9_9RHOB|nr:hypothetical protein [Candidatus Rhodobacter lobularis]KMW56567.1 putative poly(beta-D-mannuronate) O-acetylase [Candidatus Rhodobacter lobularis]
MIFSSPIFVLGFLPVFLSAYYLAPHSARNWLILLASTVFYAWWRVDALVILFAIAGVSYAAGQVAAHPRPWNPSLGGPAWRWLRPGDAWRF